MHHHIVSEDHSSTLILPKVIAGPTIRVDPLTRSTLEIIIWRYSTTTWSDSTCPVPSGVSSQFSKSNSICTSNLLRYMFKIFVVIHSRTWDFFRIFKSASLWVSDDNKRDRMETCVGNFFNCSTTEYSLLLRVLWIKPFHLWWPFSFSTVHQSMSFLFLFLSSISANSFSL